jgi:hypothetical protein
MRLKSLPAMFLAGIVGAAFVADPRCRRAGRPRFAERTVPVNLGPPVNTAAEEGAAAISDGGLSLYFKRNPSLPDKDEDLYMSRRSRPADPPRSPTSAWAIQPRSSEAMSTLYALFVPVGTHFSGPDGWRLHDHVLAVALGDSGYTGAWTVVRVTGGPNFDAAGMPYTSEAEVLAGVAAGELVPTDTGFSFRAPVTSAR